LNDPSIDKECEQRRDDSLPQRGRIEDGDSQYRPVDNCAPYRFFVALEFGVTISGAELLANTFQKETS
jgi:hypothetical protein